MCLFKWKRLQLKLLSASTLVGISKLQKAGSWRDTYSRLVWEEGRYLLGGNWFKWCKEWEATLLSKEETSIDGRGRSLGEPGPGTPSHLIMPWPPAAHPLPTTSSWEAGTMPGCVVRWPLCTMLFWVLLHLSPQILVFLLIKRSGKRERGKARNPS